jgi:hypothetical protein
LVARIVGGEALGDRRPHVDEVGEERLVEGLKGAGLDEAHDVGVGRNDDVVAGSAGEQLRLDDLVVVVDVVDDADAGLGGELVEDRLLDIVGPVIDIDDAVLSERKSAAGGEKGGGQWQPDEGMRHPVTPVTLGQTETFSLQSSTNVRFLSLFPQ